MRWTSSTALVLALVVAAAPVRAQPVDEVTARARAQALLDAGLDLTDLGDHLGALAMYQQAYATFPSPFLHDNIGTSLWNLGRYTEAAIEFEQLVAADVPEEKKAEVRGYLAELAKSIAVVTIEVAAPGARVMVDGREVALDGGRATTRVDPGAHTVVVHAPDMLPASAQVELGAGELFMIPITLEPVPAPEIIERVVTTAPKLRATAGRLGGVAELVVDPAGPGAALTVGGSWGATSWLDVTASARLGGSLGVQAGGVAFLLPGRVRPTLSLGIPAYFVDGIRPGLRGGAGVEWRVSDRIGLQLDLGVEHYPWVPDDFAKTLFAPSLAVHARM